MEIGNKKTDPPNQSQSHRRDSCSAERGKRTKSTAQKGEKAFCVLANFKRRFPIHFATQQVAVRPLKQVIMKRNSFLGEVARTRLRFRRGGGDDEASAQLNYHYVLTPSL